MESASDFKLPVSCYIRACNEEKRIEALLAPLISLCDEVIVLDSGSTDGTKRLASEMGARVIDQNWLGWGYQKRAAEEACRNRWLFDLDADEVVTRELVGSLRELFSNGREPEFGVYEVQLVTVPPYGKVWSKSCLAWRRKLYRRDRFRMPESEAFDQLDVPRSEKVGRLQGALLHYSFSGISDMHRKMNSYSTMMAETKKLKPLWLLRLRILFCFPLYFFKKYVKQQMFREGVYGFACAAVLASQRWLVDVKMYELWKGRE